MLYLIIEAAAFALEWLTLHPTSPAKALWLGSLMGLSFLVAPCLWLFAREIVEDKVPAIGSLHARHFVIVAAGIALTLPLILSTHSGPDYANPTHEPSAMRSLFSRSSTSARYPPVSTRWSTVCGCPVMSGHSEVGEPPVGPIGPAIANAIFRATGKRVRAMPLRKQESR